MRVKLLPHPDTPCSALGGIEVKVVRTRAGGLEVHYFALGTIRDIRWPEPQTSVRQDRLWETSCFELFIRNRVGRAYHEFNFSPSTNWACYRFSDYRTGMQIVRAGSPPRLATRVTDTAFVLTAALHVADFRGLDETGAWQIGLSAVIEAENGTKSCWALKHPPGKPDFHHEDCFAFALEAPGRP